MQKFPGVRALYERRLAEGALEPDAAQCDIAGRLDALARALLPAQRKTWQKTWQTPLPRLRVPGWPARRTSPPRGLYIYGGVGRGKTMLMDLFYEAAPLTAKRRHHFHEFMSEIHEDIAQARKSPSGDPAVAAASALAARVRLLCLDELNVTDIADAMILGRLFQTLFARQTILVTTSNTPPGGLYRNGLNRQLFLPFVALIEAHLDIVPLAAAKDFRLDKLSGQRLYFTPLGAAAQAAIECLWMRLAPGPAVGPATIAFKGRCLHVPRAANGAARFPFSALCEEPLGPLDYLHIAHAFHTVFVEGVPVFGPADRDSARRFITLIDTLYDSGTCLVASAAAPPAQLCPAGPLAETFERTASRLAEMQSEAYIARRRVTVPAAPPGDGESTAS